MKSDPVLEDLLARIVEVRKVVRECLALLDDEVSEENDSLD